MLQIELLQSIAGEREVPDVGRVERPTEDAKPPGGEPRGIDA
jgi:hypothetical protein